MPFSICDDSSPVHTVINWKVFIIRAMNGFNGKCHFSGSSSSGTHEPIFKKFCTFNYVGDPTPHLDQSAQRGCVCACVKLSSSGVYFFVFFSFMLIATGPPVGTIIAVNGLNDAFWWHSYHRLCGSASPVLTATYHSYGSLA